MKLRQKLAAVLAATMVVTAVPVVTMAASTNSVTQSVIVKKGEELLVAGNRPAVKIELKDDLKAADNTTAQVFFLELEGGEFLDTMGTSVKLNGADTTDITVTKTSKDEATVTVNGTVVAGDILELPIYAKATAETTKVNIIGENTVIDDESFVIAQTSEAKALVEVSETVPSFYTAGKIAEITLQEAYTGAFADAANDNGEVVFEVVLEHDDFEFVVSDSIKPELVGGRGLTLATSDYSIEYGTYNNKADKQILTITVDADALDGKSARSTLTLKGVEVDATVKNPELGDLEVSVEGDIVEDKEYKVATVADYGTSLTMKDDKVVEVVAGQKEEVEFTLAENVADTIVTGRTVEFTLDQGYFVEGSKIVVEDNNDDTTTGDKEINVDVEGSNVIVEKIDGVERVVGFEVALDAALANKIEKYTVKAEIAVPVDQTGDVTITAEGRAIDEDLELVIMEATAPVEVKTEAAVLKVGLKEQEAGKIVISETDKGMLAKGETLTFVLADEEGIDFTGKPVVEVTEGDLVLGDFEVVDETVVEDGKTVKTGRQLLEVEIKRASREASTIEITEFPISLDRTVPQGTYDLTIGGKALAEFGTLTVEEFFVVGTPNTEDITNGMRKGTAAFTNGAATYIVNDEEKEMDAAPYISEAGRMMLPVRYVSEAFGIDGNNVIFADGTVTILAGTRTLQVKNGSDLAILNGATIKMAEKVVIKEGRTYVPVGEVGRLLGVSVSFDNATKTATFTNK